MTIKDMQALYDEGHIADALTGTELLLIEQNGVSKVLRLDTAAAYFQQYFEQNSSCCDGGTIPVSTPSNLTLSGTQNTADAYGVSEIQIFANGELFSIPVSPTDNWRVELVNQGTINFGNGVVLNFTSEVVSSEDRTLLVIKNNTGGIATDSFEINLIVSSGQPQLSQTGINESYMLIDNNPAHATFQLSRG